jgi:purine-nucleoside phosphorylase
VPASPFELAAEAAAAIRQRLGTERLDALVVLGTGLGPAAQLLGAEGPPLDLLELPGFSTPTGIGHVAKAWSVDVAGTRLLVVGGRVHLYEGRSPDEVVHLVRSAVLAGCSTVALTASAGGIRPDYLPGEPVLIADHLNLTGRSPLSGLPADHPSGTPFVDLTDAWSPELRGAARRADPSLREGVYAQLPGPHLESPAEIRMLGTLGADLVGMSTVLEAIAARHLGARVLGVAVVSNPAAGLGTGPLTVEQIRAGAAAAVPRLAGVLRSTLGGS